MAKDTNSTKPVGITDVTTLRPFALTLAWQLLVEIVRHQPEPERLRILEMHPGGGMYDLLTLWDGDPYRGEATQLLALNIGIGTAHKNSEDQRRYPWVDRWLSYDDPLLVVRELAAFVGIPVQEAVNSTNRHRFGLRLIAGLLTREVSEPTPFEADMCLHDTSGYGGGVSSKLRRFSRGHIAEPTDASQWWALRGEGSGEICALVSIDGWLIPACDPDSCIDLFDHYAATDNLGATISLARRKIGSYESEPNAEEAFQDVRLRRRMVEKLSAYSDYGANGERLIDYQSKFLTTLNQELIPDFCSKPSGVYMSHGFKKSPASLAELDLRDFLRAWNGGLLTHLGGGLYRAPRSSASEQFFWSGQMTGDGKSFTLWREPIITVAALARLHWDLGWPLHLIGTQSSDWAFDLVAFKPDNSREQIAGEVKKSVEEIDELVAYMEAFCADPHIPPPATGKALNAYKKVASLRTKQPPVFWALGPAGYEKLFQVRYQPGGEMDLLPGSAAVLRYPF